MLVCFGLCTLRYTPCTHNIHQLSGENLLSTHKCTQRVRCAELLAPKAFDTKRGVHHHRITGRGLFVCNWNWNSVGAVVVVVFVVVANAAAWQFTFICCFDFSFPSFCCCCRLILLPSFLLFFSVFCLISMFLSLVALPALRSFFFRLCEEI